MYSDWDKYRRARSMNRMWPDQLRIWLATCLVAVLLAPTTASAQFTKGKPQAPIAPQFPAGAVQTPDASMTPAQIQSLYLLRALQSRGSRGVRTGVPQFVPFGGPGFMSGPMYPMQNVQPQATSSSTADKRAAARAAREEKNRLAREKAEAKREAAAKAKAEAARAKAKDPA